MVSLPYPVEYLVVEERQSCEGSNTGYQQSTPVNIVPRIVNIVPRIVNIVPRIVNIVPRIVNIVPRIIIIVPRIK